MRVRGEITLGIGLLVGIQVLTSFAAVGLLGRMAPALGQILAQDAASNEAAEQMLRALVTEEGVTREAARERFQAAFASARGAVSEEAELPQLARIRQHADAALADDAVAQREVSAALHELTAINRASMRAAHASALRLGIAGAWAAVGLGMTSFGLSVFVARRLTRRLEGPLTELDQVFAAVRGGDLQRRAAITDAPAELRRVAVALNLQLDERLEQEGTRAETVAMRDRLALLHVLDAQPDPIVLVDASDRIHAMNQAAEARLAGPEGPQLRALLREGREPWVADVVREGDLISWRLRHETSPSAS